MNDDELGRRVAAYARSLRHRVNDRLAERADRGLSPREAYTLLHSLRGRMDPIAGAGFWRGDADPVNRDPYRLHLRYRDEWFFILGHLKDDRGRQFGLHWALCRQATGSSDADTPGTHLFCAHLALTEKSTQQHRQLQDICVAGESVRYSANPFRVELPSASCGTNALESAGDDRIRLQMSGGMFIPWRGDGSFPMSFGCMYDLANIDGSGTLTLDGITASFTGRFWIQHAWLTATLPWLPPGTATLLRLLKLHPLRVAWQWLFVHFDDGAVLCLMRQRHEVTCGYADARGDIQFVKDARLSTLNDAFDPQANAPVPKDLRVTSSALKLDVELVPWAANQPVRTPFGVYREGATDVRGTKDSRPVTGLGFAEAVGYEDLDTWARKALALLGLDESHARDFLLH
jgi:predicted secreted hydrolase